MKQVKMPQSKRDQKKLKAKASTKLELLRTISRLENEAELPRERREEYHGERPNSGISIEISGFSVLRLCSSASAGNEKMTLLAPSRRAHSSSLQPQHKATEQSQQ